MNHNHSLLQTSQELLAPDMVQKLTEFTGESFSRVREVLMSVVPNITSKILERGATVEGASRILEVVKNDSEGAEIKRISDDTDRDSTTEKILEFIGPKLFRPVRDKIVSEKLNVYGLRNYFEQEQKYAAGMSPETSEYYQLSGNDPFDETSRIGNTTWYGLSFFLLILSISAIVSWFDRLYL